MHLVIFVLARVKYSRWHCFLCMHFKKFHFIKAFDTDDRWLAGYLPRLPSL